ncbi:MAG TPA: hypothetical protein PKB13_07475 [Clostridia bacterium]|nr:hypothetical protein [Clostridia bacterium]
MSKFVRLENVGTMEKLTVAGSPIEFICTNVSGEEEQLNRIAEICAAERDGLLHIAPDSTSIPAWLPCKVGSEVWCWSAVGELQKCVVEHVHFSGDTTQIDVYFSKRGELFDTYEFEPDDFGKTVFLTRSEAEAALAKEGGQL